MKSVTAVSKTRDGAKQLMKLKYPDTSVVEEMIKKTSPLEIKMETLLDDNLVVKVEQLDSMEVIRLIITIIYFFFKDLWFFENC